MGLRVITRYINSGGSISFIVIFRQANKFTEMLPNFIGLRGVRINTCLIYHDRQPAGPQPTNQKSLTRKALLVLIECVYLRASSITLVKAINHISMERYDEPSLEAAEATLRVNTRRHIPVINAPFYLRRAKTPKSRMQWLRGINKEGSNMSYLPKLMSQSRYELSDTQTCNNIPA